MILVGCPPKRCNDNDRDNDRDNDGVKVRIRWRFKPGNASRGKVDR